MKTILTTLFIFISICGIAQYNLLVDTVTLYRGGQIYYYHTNGDTVFINSDTLLKVSTVKEYWDRNSQSWLVPLKTDDSVQVNGKLKNTGIPIYSAKSSAGGYVAWDAADSVFKVLKAISGDYLPIHTDTAYVEESIKLGDQAAGVDYAIDFDGEDNSAAIQFMEDEDGFKLGSHIYLYETATPTAITDWGSLYTKADNNLYFQDGDGMEHDLMPWMTHMFLYFGDSTISYNVTTGWQHATNAYRDMYVHDELEGFSISNDTITFTYGGDYELNASITLSGDNGETQSVRFLKIDATESPYGIPVGGAWTTRGSGNYGTIPIVAYDSIGPGDKVVLQIKADANGTNVFKNGLILIKKIHN